MNIYFAASIRGGRQDADIYILMVEHLKKYGTVLTEHVGNPNVKAFETGQSDTEIHNQDINWLLNSDIVIAEVSSASLGVGYEIGRAIENNIPVICFFRKNSINKLSAMISGNKSIKTVFYSTIDDFRNFIDNETLV